MLHRHDIYEGGGAYFKFWPIFLVGGGGSVLVTQCRIYPPGSLLLIRPNPQDGDIKIGDFFVAALTAEKISKGG